MVYPRAYHLTWGVYIGRPPGSGRPHVDRQHNVYGTPLAPTDPLRERAARANANFDPVE